MKNMSFNAIRENKILAKISEFKVPRLTRNTTWESLATQNGVRSVALGS